MKKRLLSLVLSLAMVLTMTPVLAGAAEEEEGVTPDATPYTADATGDGEATEPASGTEDDNDIAETGLDFTNGLPESDTTYKVGNGLVKFTTPPTSADELPTLTLENATMTGNIRLGANAVNIVVVGSNSVGQIVANDAKLNITGTGSLTAIAVQASKEGVYIKIDGALVLNGGASIGMIYGETDVTAASITMNGYYGVGPASGKAVKLTATTGDIQFHGEPNASYFIGSGSSLVELTADKGSIICEGGGLQSAAVLQANKDIIFTKTAYVQIINSSLTAKSTNGNIRIQSTGSSGGHAFQAYGDTVINLTAENGKVTVTAAHGAFDVSSGTVQINAKEVEISSTESGYSTIAAKNLSIKGDKVTITGYGSSSYSPVIRATNGTPNTITSNDLFIKATAVGGYAIASYGNNSDDVINLVGTGTVIGIHNHDTVDGSITFLGPSSGELTSLYDVNTYSVFTCGDGYAVYDPESEQKTLLLQDATISNRIFLPSDDIAVTIKGSLTVTEGKALNLENAESMTVETDAPLKIDGDFAPISTITADELKAWNLSGGGDISYTSALSKIITLDYQLDGGTNNASNPTTYIDFTTYSYGGQHEPPAGYYPIALGAPTKDGYDFKGWYSDPDYQDKVDAIVEELDKLMDPYATTLTLYAQWEKKQSGGSSSGGSSSGSSGGSSSGNSSTNAVSTPGKSENGSVSTDKSSAKKGDTVTITVKPDAGYTVGGVTVKDANGKTIAVTDKGNGKYTFVMPGTKVTITPEFVEEQPEAVDYSDVDSGAWYNDAVQYVSGKGLMNGTGNGKFSPNGLTTRGMIMTILARNAGVDTGGAVWYEKGMNWAKANGVSDGTNPTATITREQLAAMLYRYAGSPSTNGSLDSFADADSVSAYAVSAMQWAVENGIVNGANGKLNPQNNATRAEVAAILMRFCEKDAK